jgi:predicted phage-related endonuclease
MDIQWNDDCTISIDPPKRPKKLTGTRFASVLGMNRWNTPFQIWCDITKTVVIPFEDTKYTLAGKAIEPKQIEYMRESYGMDNLVDPTQEFGEDYFSKTYGNFFDHEVLGGMWDSLLKDEGGNVEGVLEFKTTSRPQDWLNDDGEVDPPEYYALQAALYAYLLDCDYVVMVVTFLTDKDYEHPEEFVPNAENTQPYEFNVSERYPNFEEEYVKPALAWWERHVETGNSPEFDEKKDADYLKVLRNVSLNPNSDIDELLKELRECQKRIDVAEATVKEDAKRVKVIKEQLKKYALENIGEEDTLTIEGSGVTCKLTRTVAVKINEDAMRDDGIFDKYAEETESTRFNVKFEK